MRRAIALLLAGLAVSAAAQARPAIPEKASGPETVGLAFERSPDGLRWSVWVARADGSQQRRLAMLALDPLLSRDGRSVLYRKCRRGPLKPCDELRLARVAGGGRVLARSEGRSYIEAAWAPDSRQAVVDTGKSLLLLDTETGDRTVLDRGAFYGLSFSPTGDELAYVKGTGSDPGVDELDLYVVALADGQIRRLTTHGQALFPLWGPPGIVYRRYEQRGIFYAGDLFLIQPDGSGERRLTRRARSFIGGVQPLSFSADGRLLGGCWQGEFACPPVVVAVASGEIRDLRVPDRFGTETYGRALSRDGRRFLVEAGSFDDYHHDRVLLLSMGSSSAVVLIRDASNPSWRR